MFKTKKIIILILGIIALGVVASWYLGRQTNVKVSESGSGFSVKNFFPFGNADKAEITNTDMKENAETANNQNNLSNQEANIDVPKAKLRKISERPIAGAIIFNLNKSTTSIVRFVEKATGNVYEARSDSANVRRLTNETIPKIIRSLWLPDGSGFLAQKLDENEIIYTSFIKLKPSTATSTNNPPLETVISNLPTDIKEIGVSPDSKKIFYYITNTNTNGYTANPDGTNPVLVFSNFLTEWIPKWFGENNISIASKASSGAKSVGFVLNINNKTLSKTYDNVFGASSLMRTDGKYVLLGNGSNSLSLFERASSKNSPINIKTFPEKCVWHPTDLKFIFCGVPKDIARGSYPDAWYRGIAKTNDLIQKINVFDLYTYILIDPEKVSEESVDTENIQSSKDGSFLIFVNKTNSSLWMLDTR